MNALWIAYAYRHRGNDLYVAEGFGCLGVTARDARLKIWQGKPPIPMGEILVEAFPEGGQLKFVLIDWKDKISS